MYMKNPVNDVNTSYFSEAELRGDYTSVHCTSEPQTVLVVQYKTIWT